MSRSYDVLVIGAGSGGMAAAKRAASRGASVGIVEERTVGENYLEADQVVIAAGMRPACPSVERGRIRRNQRRVSKGPHASGFHGRGRGWIHCG